jgi:hypothetical protein
MTKNVLIGSLLIFIAVFIDALQFLIGLTITVTFIAGSAAVGWIPVIGIMAASAGTIAGDVIGSTIDVCLSVSLGTLLCTLLFYADMFYPKYLFSGSIFELLPFVDILPGWTAMTVASVWRKSTENSTVLNLASTVLTGDGAGAVAAAAVSAGKELSSRTTGVPAQPVPRAPRSQLLDIRPAHNNTRARTAYVA